MVAVGSIGWRGSWFDISVLSSCMKLVVLIVWFAETGDGVGLVAVVDPVAGVVDADMTFIAWEWISGERVQVLSGRNG